jgi:hypothetical protein
MKKIFLALFVVFTVSITIVAQPTLTQANFVPLIGESQLYYIADTNTILDNTTGANVIFNYTQMRGYGQTQTQYFVDPTTTLNTTDFPTATYTDTTGGSPGNMKYNQDFTDSLNTIGLVLDINTFGVVVAKYDNDPEILMKFPFNYTDSFTDAYGGQFTSAAAPVPTNATGTVSVSADAWGTLRLPMTPDIDSVLRVVRIENMLTDTIFLQPLFPNILPIPVNATQISYYKPSISKNPLLSFITADVNGDTSISVISQYPMYGVGIEEINENIDILIFPNPANKNFTTLTFDLENKASVNVSIFNNLGQRVKEVFNGKLQKGENKLKVKTSNLSKGLYFININIDNKTITKKLLIE